MFTSIVFFCIIFIIVATVIIVLVIVKDAKKVNIKFIPNNDYIYNASTGKLLLNQNIFSFSKSNIIIDKVLILKDLYLSLIILVCRYNYVIPNDVISTIKSTQDKYKSYLSELDLEDNNVSPLIKYEIVMYRCIHIFLKEKFNNFSNENYDSVETFLIKDQSSLIIKQDTLENCINSINTISYLMFYFYIIKYYTKMDINIDMLDKICKFIRQYIYYSWAGYIENNVMELILLHNLIVPNKDYILSKQIFTSFNTNFMYVPLKYELVFGNNTNDELYFNKYMSSLRYSFDNILIFCMYANNNNNSKTCIDFNNQTSYLAKKILNNNRLLSDQIIFKKDQDKMNIGSFVYEYKKNIFFIGCCLETNSYFVTVINKNGIIVIRDYNLKNDFSYNLYVEYILNKYDNYPYFIKSKNTMEEKYDKDSIFDIKKILLVPIITKTNNKLFESFIGKQVIDYLYDNENKSFTIDDISFSLNPNLASFNIIPKDVKLVKVSLKDKDLYYDIDNKLVSMDNYKSEIDKNGCNFVLYPHHKFNYNIS